MFRAGIHTQTGGPYFRAGTNTGNGWATLLHSKVLWLVRWFVDSLIIPMVFHMPINRLGMCLKHIQSGDCGVTCDRVDDQSLGRSCDTFPGSHACISHPKVVKMSRDQTHDRSCDSFPGSRGWRVDPTMWLYFSLGAGLEGLGLGILCVHDVADSILNSYTMLHFAAYMTLSKSLLLSIHRTWILRASFVRKRLCMLCSRAYFSFSAHLSPFQIMWPSPPLSPDWPHD